MSTFSGCFTGDGTPLYQRTGRRQTKRSSIWRSATFSERMPPPTGVVSGPLMPTRYSRNASTRVVGQPVVELLEALLAGVDLDPGDLALAAVGLRHRGVEHAHAGAPDVGPGAVAFDERDDRIVGNDETAVLLA